MLLRWLGARADSLWGAQPAASSVHCIEWPVFARAWGGGKSGGAQSHFQAMLASGPSLYPSYWLFVKRTSVRAPTSDSNPLTGALLIRITSACPSISGPSPSPTRMCPEPTRAHVGTTRGDPKVRPKTS